jgi:predicted nucleic acid-binding protein
MNGGYLLDTNIPSETLRPSPDAKVAAWLENHPKNSQFLSVVTLGELRRGISLLAPGARRTQLERFIELTVPLWFADRVLPMTQAIAERWGILDGQRQAAGRPLSVPDGMIAATALEHRLTVATRNTKDLEGLGLTVINPWLDQ